MPFLRRAAAGERCQAAAQLPLQTQDPGWSAKWPAGVGTSADGGYIFVFRLAKGLIAEELAPGLRNPGCLPGSPVEQVVGVVAAAVRQGAGPSEGLGRGHDAGANRVALGVTECGPEVALVQRAGVEAALPDVSASRLPGIEVGGVASVRIAEREGKGLRPPRDGDEMNMVGHEAVAEDG